MQRTRDALIGSGVVAGVTFIAQQTQTTRLIEAGTDQYRQAAQEERARAAADDGRRAGRQARGRAAAFALLQVLADLDKALPDLRSAGTPRFRGALRTPEWLELAADRAEHALD